MNIDPDDVDDVLKNYKNIENENIENENIENIENIEKINIPTLDYVALKSLKENIDNLGETEYIEILKILIKNNEKFTENKNGIFINTSKINQNTLLNINTFVQYCLSNTDLLEQNKIYEKNIDKNYTSYDKNYDSIHIDSACDVINMSNNNYILFKSRLTHIQSQIYEKSIEPIYDMVNKKKNIRINNLRKKKRDIDYAYNNELHTEEYIL